MKALPNDAQAKLAYVDFLVAQRSMERGIEVLQQYIAQRAEELRLAVRPRHASAALRSTPTMRLRRTTRSSRRTRTASAACPRRLRIATMHVAARRFDDASKLIAQVLREESARQRCADPPRQHRARAEGPEPRRSPTCAPCCATSRARVSLLRTLARAYVANGDKRAGRRQPALGGRSGAGGHSDEDRAGEAAFADAIATSRRSRSSKRP